MNVNVEIFIKALNGGFSYKAVAQDDEGNRYSVEGWASGSQKEVERLVQRKLDVEIKRQRALQQAKADKKRKEATATVEQDEAEVQALEELKAAVLAQVPTVSVSKEPEALPTHTITSANLQVRYAYKRKSTEEKNKNS